MIDPIQTLLTIVIIFLGILFIVIAVQLILLLNDFKKTMIKINQIIDDTSEITSNVKVPIIDCSKLIVGLKSGLSVVNLISRFKKGREEE